MVIEELKLTNNSIEHTIEDGCKITGLELSENVDLESVSLNYDSIKDIYKNVRVLKFFGRVAFGENKVGVSIINTIYGDADIAGFINIFDVVEFEDYSCIILDDNSIIVELPDYEDLDDDINTNYFYIIQKVNN